MYVEAGFGQGRERSEKDIVALSGMQTSEHPCYNRIRWNSYLGAQRFRAIVQRLLRRDCYRVGDKMYALCSTGADLVPSGIGADEHAVGNPHQTPVNRFIKTPTAAMRWTQPAVNMGDPGLTPEEAHDCGHRVGAHVVGVHQDSV